MSAADAAYVSSWLDYLRYERRLSAHSLAAYEHDIQHILPLSEPVSPSSLTPALLRQKLAELHAGGLHPRSLQRTLAAWRNFFHWWCEQQPEHPNPCSELKAPKSPRPLPSSLSVDQAQQLLDHQPAQSLEHLSPMQVRDQAMFELLYSSGLRLSELVSLDTHYVKQAGYESSSWLSLQDAELQVLGKGNKRRSLPIGSKALHAVQCWLQQRSSVRRSPTEDTENHYALFLGSQGKRIHPRMVQTRLQKLCQEAGLSLDVSPHALRHSFASHMLQSAQDLRAVQELLGHSNISTTQIYTRLDFQHLAQVYDNAHPRARRKP